MNTVSAAKTADVEVPVLIVGGGGAGLTCSMLLAQLGVETLLVSSLPTTSILPKAHVLNQRTMERRHDRLPITKTFRFRPSLNVNGIPLKDADFRSSGA